MHTQSYLPMCPSGTTRILVVVVKVLLPWLLLQLGGAVPELSGWKDRGGSLLPLPAKQGCSPGRAWLSLSCCLEVQQPFCDQEDKAIN